MPTRRAIASARALIGSRAICREGLSRTPVSQAVHRRRRRRRRRRRSGFYDDVKET